MLFPFLHSKHFDKSYAVFAIDTSSVTLTVFEEDKKGKKKISYIARLALEFDSVSEPALILRAISKRIGEIFKAIRKERAFSLLKHSTEIFVLVGSPWHVGWNDQVKIDQEEKFRVTESLIGDAVESAFKDAHPDLRIIGKHISGYKLNGYVIENPIAMFSNSLEISVYLSSVPALFLETIEQNIKSELPHNKVKFLSYNSVANTVLTPLRESGDCLILIPENELTEIVLVRNNSIKSEASIPFGSATLARSIFAKQSSGVKESLSKMRRFISGELDIKNLDEVGAHIAKEKDAFMTEFREILWKMNDALLLPDDLYIIGRNIASHFITDWIKEEKYTNQTFTINGFKIANIRGNDVMTKDTQSEFFAKKTMPFNVAVSLKLTDIIK